MAIQAMALGVQNPEINALAGYAQGAQAGQQQQMGQIEIARANLQDIAQMANDTGGDPAKWEQGLDIMERAGFPVQSYRGRADLAPLVSKAALTAAEEVQFAQNEQQLDLSMQRLQHELQQAAKGTADQQNFHAAQADPKGFGAFLTGKNAPNPPSNVGEYNFYSQQETAAGRQPLSFAEYQASLKGNGLTVTTNPDGTTTVQQGGAPKALTEGQSKDTVYATRASSALPDVEKYEQNLLSLGENVAGNVPLLGNFMQSEEYQLGRDAGLDFLAAILRKDTGAAVTPSEEALYGRIFLPQPGDKPAVVAAKRERRALAVEAIKAGMPPQALENMANALATQAGTDVAAPSPAATPSTSGPQVGDEEDGYRFKGGDPSAAENWEKI